MSEKKKVLVVDDEKSILDLLKIKIENEGYEVVVADQGALAIDLAKQVCPDIVIMDVMLPDMNGAEIVKQIGDALNKKDIPVIFLTGMVKKEEADGLLEINVEGEMKKAMAKPIDMGELLASIRELLK